MNSLCLTLLCEIAALCRADRAVVTVGIDFERNRAPVVVFKITAHRNTRHPVHAQVSLSGCERTSAGQESDADRELLEQLLRKVNAELQKL